MGFPDELHEKIYGGGSPESKKKSPYFTSTTLFLEMQTVQACNLGSLEAWGKLPWWERMLWEYFVILKNEKEIVQDEQATADAKAKHDADQRAAGNAPKVGAMPRPRIP